MRAQHAAAAFGEHAKVAARLRGLDNAEGRLAAGNLHVERVLAGDLKEYPGVRPAFVGLAGRMQEAGPEFRAGRYMLAVPDRSAQPLQRFQMRGLALDVGEHGEIIAGADAGEMRAQPALDRVARAGTFQRPRISVIGEQRDAVVLEYRALGRKRAVPFVGFGERAGGDFARLDVGLVERMNPDQGAGNRRRDLPAEKFLSEQPGRSEEHTSEL